MIYVHIFLCLMVINRVILHVHGISCGSSVHEDALRADQAGWWACHLTLKSLPCAGNPADSRQAPLE